MASKAVILSSIVLNGLLLRVGICCFISYYFFLFKIVSMIRFMTWQVHRKAWTTYIMTSSEICDIKHNVRKNYSSSSTL
jgi:hypothetical protein